MLCFYELCFTFTWLWHLLECFLISRWLLERYLGFGDALALLGIWALILLISVLSVYVCFAGGYVVLCWVMRYLGVWDLRLVVADLLMLVGS